MIFLIRHLLSKRQFRDNTISLQPIMAVSTSFLKDWVTDNPRLSVVLNRFQQSPSPARSASFDTFLEEIMEAFEDPEALHPARFQRYPVPVILDYLYRTHQYYLTRRLPEIEQSAEALMLHCGEKAPMLALLQPFLIHYRSHLATHIKEEEEVLFPYISYLFLRKEFGESFARHACGDLLPVSLGNQHEEMEHRMAGGLEQWRQVIRRSHPDILDTWPCQVLFHQLDAFSKDMRLHERLEEEVLIPLARQLQ
jgi:regulator of cell morphogenesis and NO signaling